MHLSLRAASLGWDGGETLLDDVSITLTAGWTGLVGANGAGKSTLLAGLLGEPVVRAGQRDVGPGPLQIARVHQRPVDCPGEVSTFAWCFDGDALRLRSRLELADDGVARWATLSPGQRQRWQIAALLYARPHVLALDEPFNHLDVDARRALVDALRLHDGIGVIVSHDVAMLDALSVRTVRVADGRVTTFDEPVTRARARWQAAEAAALEAAEGLRSRHAAALRRHEAQRRALMAAERRRSAGARASGIRDTDARSAAAQVRADVGATAAARAAGRIGARIERIETARAAVTAVDRGSAFSFTAAETRAPYLASLDGVDLGYGDHVVLRDVTLRVPRTARWWIRGPNGAGKTTLFEALAQALNLDTDEVVVVRQDAVPPETTRAEILTLPPAERGAVLSRAGALGVDVDRLLGSPVWSPGQAARVRLARAALTPAVAVLLDEPTNHLDIEARQVLGDALAAFDGAVVLVTHDEALGARVAQRELVVGDGRVVSSAPTPRAAPA